MMPLRPPGAFRLLLTLVVVIALGILFSGGPSPLVAQTRPCEDDIKKFCPNANPGGLRKCLEDNREKLSEGCKKRLGQGGRRYPARFQGCETDLDKFCKGITPGAGRLLRCLRDHNSELSEPCAKRLAARGGGTPRQTEATHSKPAETPGGSRSPEGTPKPN